jgi:deazaflavin-dependent oxidoreductase (nitroreductase family)
MVIAACTLILFTLLVIPILLVRFQKRRLAVFHRAITNRIMRQFAARLPGFGILTHEGRKTRRQYRTPVNIFKVPEGFLIALTYGRNSGWVKNILAAGSCQLDTQGVHYQLIAPVIVNDRSRQRFPFVVRVILAPIDANDYLQLSNSPHEPRAAAENSNLQTK